MGVLRCNRKGCENIMCDRYSNKYGYICNDCFDELKDSDISIKNFMNTEREDFCPDTNLETLDKIFPINDNGI